MRIRSIVALIPNLWQNAPVPKSIRKTSHDNALRKFQCGSSSHKQSDSDESPEDFEKSILILKNPQNGFFKSIFSSVPTDGPQMKFMKRKFGHWWNSNIYRKFLSRSRAHGNFLPFGGRTRPGCFEITDSRLCLSLAEPHFLYRN